jgi:hypothetical protein
MNELLIFSSCLMLLCGEKQEQVTLTLVMDQKVMTSCFVGASSRPSVFCRLFAAARRVQVSSEATRYRRRDPPCSKAAMKALAFALLVLVHGVCAQCEAPVTELDNCMSANEANDAEKNACEACIVAAVAKVSEDVNCEELKQEESALCTALHFCPTCRLVHISLCSPRVEALALCEVNEKVGTNCTTLSCFDDVPIPAPTHGSPIDITPTTTPPPTDTSKPPPMMTSMATRTFSKMSTTAMIIGGIVTMMMALVED